MPKITIYSTNRCPFCVSAKRLVEEKNFAFEEINLSTQPDELIALKNKTGMRTVPQIFIGDEFIGGFQELSALNESGELDKKMAEND